MRFALSRCAQALLLPLLASLAGAQDMIAVSWEGEVYGVDSIDGSTTHIGSTGLGVGANAMAIDAAGVVYIGQRQGSAGSYTYDLATLDPATGQGTLQGLQQSQEYVALAFDSNGTLYAIVDRFPYNDELHTVDPTTGASMRVGDTGFSSLYSLVWANGKLYSWDNYFCLVEIDPATGVAVDLSASYFLGSTQFLAARSDGAIFGGATALKRVNSVTEILEPVGNDPFGADLRGCDFLSTCYRIYGDRMPPFHYYFNPGPELRLAGCATSGGTAVLEVSKGGGGQLALMLFGQQQANIPTPWYTPIYVQPLMPVTLAFTLSGSGMGNGSYSLTLPLPAGLRGASVTTQVLTWNSTWPATTNGLQILIQ